MSQPAVMLYALSTCVHCRHTREFLDKNAIAYDYVYVDELEGKEQQDTLEKVRAVNRGLSFPTMIIGPSHTVVVGFDPESIKEALAT